MVNVSNIEEKICEAKIICVTVFEKEEEVAPTIEALLKANVRCIELALRSPYALRAVELVKQKYPEILLGVGTVIEPQQLESIAQIADFAVAPGMNRRVIEAAAKAKIPFYPGVATASEIEAALEYNVRLLKFFPAEPMGGLSYLQNINAPYAHLSLRYVPLGGINIKNLSDYLQSPLIGAVGGSWLASRKLITEKNWGMIRQQAEEASRLVKTSKESF